MPNSGLHLFPLLLSLVFLLGAEGCASKKVPPADLITPDQDSAELYDPMNPQAFALQEGTNAVSPAAYSPDGLTPEDEEISVKGSGNSMGDPAVIRGVFSRLGKMEVENDFISEKLGKEGEDWKTLDVSVIKSGGRTFEVIKTEGLKGQGARQFYFDVTEYADSWE